MQILVGSTDIVVYFEFWTVWCVASLNTGEMCFIEEREALTKGQRVCVHLSPIISSGANRVPVDALKS